MAPLSFNIFIPDGKIFRWTRNWINLLLWVAWLLVSWLSGGPIKDSGLNVLSFLLLFLAAVTTLYFSLFKVATYEPLRGTFSGALTFNNNFFQVDDEVYYLKDVDSIIFRFNHYQGQMLYKSRGDVNGALSRGVDNYFEFADFDGNVQSFYFEVINQNDFYELYPFINEAVRLNALV